MYVVQSIAETCAHFMVTLGSGVHDTHRFRKGLREENLPGS